MGKGKNKRGKSLSKTEAALRPSNQSQSMGKGKNKRGGKRKREAADNLRWDQPHPSSSHGYEFIMFRLVCDEGFDGKCEGGQQYSRFYFIKSDDLFGAAPLGGEGPISYYRPISRKPPYRSTSIPVYLPLVQSPDLPSYLSSPFSNAAVVDCALYVIGGYANNSPITDVYSLDMGRLAYFTNLIQSRHHLPYNFCITDMKRAMFSDGWKRRQSMNFPKSAPRSLSLDGKIYVFGFERPGTPFVEVYSPQDDKWESASSDYLPSDDVAPILAVLSDGNNSDKHILMQPSDTSYEETDLYTYSLANKTFSSLEQKSYKPFLHPVVCQSAVVDGILYCYREEDGAGGEGKEEIVGYDLTATGEDKSWAPITVLGFSPHITFPVPNIQLLPLFDNLMCVLWTAPASIHNNKEDKGKMLVVVMTFEMSRLRRNPKTCRINDPSILLQASHVSSICYKVPGYGDLLDCLVI